MPISKSIASILGALDDKIDLNRRMNETLEAMARAIFKDWFVDFGPTRAKMEGGAPYLAPEIWALFPDRLDDEGKPEGWQYSAVATDRLEFTERPKWAVGCTYLERWPTLSRIWTSHDATDKSIPDRPTRIRKRCAVGDRMTPCLEDGECRVRASFGLHGRLRIDISSSDMRGSCVAIAD